jgi:hypothetical protein
VDPDPHSTESADSDTGRPKCFPKRMKLMLGSWMFSWSLAVLHGGLRRNKYPLQVALFYPKNVEFFFICKISQVFYIYKKTRSTI